jgi:hypothetical protein
MIRRLLPAVCVFALLAAVALGQENDPAINPENVDKLPLSRPIVEYALAGGFLLAALAIGFMPSKRAKDA